MSPYLASSVRPTGLEPVAYCLEGSCSIQLSYGRLYNAGPVEPFGRNAQLRRIGLEEYCR